MIKWLEPQVSSPVRKSKSMMAFLFESPVQKSTTGFLFERTRFLYPEVLYEQHAYSFSIYLKVLFERVGLLALPQIVLILLARHIIEASILRCVRSIGSGSSPLLQQVQIMFKINPFPIIS